MPRQIVSWQKEKEGHGELEELEVKIWEGEKKEQRRIGLTETLRRKQGLSKH